MTALLGQFIRKPRGVRFNGQDSKEEILLFMRQHVIVNLRWILITSLLVFAIPIYNYLVSFGGTSFSLILPAN